ncbi:SDR family NAD(P)-dependent oxidoreductase [Neolewinella lacunae]|uniref:SDR family NAD(P)-dependent oxidoreductase n=1 Tax=Neolewinella lacunae TaxID=1517758 RepID=A0A923T7I2_9BACT|nr:SDR family NAD(P)-dependent oxidoreductase [Neolewinella lacunae]MBC6993609.1 SDR family NAD(P)-dependent oxidoreductase [Neolewinella lacunae]MDN3633459.1 SDR family NAD(P)-dependent oxidoreductase [Neolewinella lacunae]
MSKTVLITGATAGIGFATAQDLAARGYTVLLHGRNRAKTEAARDQILAEQPSAQVKIVMADLGQLAEVARLAEEVRTLAPTLDVLINNAGVWNSQQELTAEGVEKTFAVNHLAYFLLSHLLLPALRRSADGRIVCVASDSHKQIKGMFFDNINLDGNYHGLRSYAQSKLANVLFCYEYERRRKSQDPAIFAVQPGLVQTDIGLKGNTWLHSLAWKVRRRMSGNKTPAQGAATSIYLATEPGLAEQSGLYWDNCQPKKSFSSSYDRDEARILWEMSEEMTGIGNYFQP